jgi:hypothetical protein
MAYTVSSKELLLGRMAGGALLSLPPRSTAVATEAAGTPAARFLPSPFSSLSQLVQPPSNLVECDLGGLGDSADGAAHATRGGSRASPLGRAHRPQGGSPKGGLARGVHVLFVQ